MTTKKQNVSINQVNNTQVTTAKIDLQKIAAKQQRIEELKAIREAKEIVKAKKTESKEKKNFAKVEFKEEIHSYKFLVNWVKTNQKGIEFLESLPYMPDLNIIKVLVHFTEKQQIRYNETKRLSIHIFLSLIEKQVYSK